MGGRGPPRTGPPPSGLPAPMWEVRARGPLSVPQPKTSIQGPFDARAACQIPGSGHRRRTWGTSPLTAPHPRAPGRGSAKSFTVQWLGLLRSPQRSR